MAKNRESAAGVGIVERPALSSREATMGTTTTTTTTTATIHGHARRISTATMDILTTTRRQASEEHERAARAERAYRVRKNATIARATLRETREHFSAGMAHLGRGLVGLFAVARATPYLLGERREKWRREDQARKRARAEALRERLEGELRGETRGGGGREEDDGGEMEEVVDDHAVGSRSDLGEIRRERERELTGRRRVGGGWFTGKEDR